LFITTTLSTNAASKQQNNLETANNDTEVHMLHLSI